MDERFEDRPAVETTVPTTLRSPTAPLVAAALLAACAEDPRDPLPPYEGYEGSFELTRVVTTLPGESPSTFLFAEASFEYAGETLDAGGSVVLDGPAGEIRLVRRQFLGRTFYQKDPDGPDIPASKFLASSIYAATVAGSKVDHGVPSFTADAAIETPESLVLSAPDLSSGLVSLDGTSSLLVTWNPSTADYVDIHLIVSSGGVAQVASFRSIDDGDYEVPDFRVAELPVGDGSFSVVRVVETAFALPGGGSAEGIGGDAVSCKLTRTP